MLINYSYMLWMLPALAISVWAQWRVQYGAARPGSGLTGYAAAEAVLERNGVRGVSIEPVPGSLTDHYDPRTNTIRLSDPVYAHASVSAVGVAAHEAGHAVQYAQGYAPMLLRKAILPLCNAGAGLAPWLLLAGLLLDVAQLYLAGIIAFSAAAVFQLVTLPVEFNASARALQALEAGGALTAEERRGVRSVLTAAALTYVAALLTALLQILYFVSRYNGRGKR